MDLPKIAPSEVSTRPPKIQLATSNVAPPTALYIQQGERIGWIVSAPNFTLPITVVHEVRLLRPDGVIVPSRFRHRVTLSGQRFSEDLGEGFILGVSGSSFAAAASQLGQVFDQAFLIKGDIQSTPDFDLQLYAGYITATHGPNWPFGSIEAPQAGPGAIRSITGADPAPGNEISETVPNNTRWRLVSFRALLVTDITAGNRDVLFQVDDGVNLIFESVFPGSQAPSSTMRHQMSDWGFNAAGAANRNLFPMPGYVLLLSGFRIRTLTSVLAAGDNWGAPQYEVEEWVNV